MRGLGVWMCGLCVHVLCMRDVCVGGGGRVGLWVSALTLPELPPAGQACSKPSAREPAPLRAQSLSKATRPQCPLLADSPRGPGAVNAGEATFLCQAGLAYQLTHLDCAQKCV